MGDQVEQPTSLYKFYAFNENSLKVLVNQEVWFSSRQLFNDPFDCRIDLRAEGDPEKYIASVERLLASRGAGISDIEHALTEKDKFEETVRKLIEEAADQSGVFCMTKKPDDILMWSHYAASHTGFCLEIALEDFVTEQPGLYLVGANYDDHPQVSILEAMEGLDGGDGLNLKGLRLLLAHKDKAWKYEEEWRLFVSLEGNMPGRTVSMPGTITKIAFGLRMKEVDQMTIMNILGREMKYVKACRKPHSYELYFKEVQWPSHMERVLE